MPSSLIQTDNDNAAKILPASVDLGPSEEQTLSGLQCDSPDVCKIDRVLCILPSLPPHIPKEKDTHVIQTLNKELDLHNKKNHTTIQFPYASLTPINE